jgi:hypothetical protein
LVVTIPEFVDNATSAEGCKIFPVTDTLVVLLKLCGKVLIKVG